MAATAYLFVPGDRPDRFGKAVACGADVVILDLEDAVGAGAKDQARAAVREWLGRGRAMVRINAPGTPWFDTDAAMVAALGVPVMVPKAETPEVLAGFGEVVALVETAREVERAAELAAVPSVRRLAFGSVDLAAELGVAPEDREPFAYARSRLVIASAAAGLAPPVDGVTAESCRYGSRSRPDRDRSGVPEPRRRRARRPRAGRRSGVMRPGRRARSPRRQHARQGLTDTEIALRYTSP
ncbi:MULTISPECIES: HpcH/HpaI aldolase/citrate lyase family protein [Amycolatopsis]|uniref:HpcH/HpaI aldolase/citrate lyase family protein n=1 Tax=Amycolatopsis TaxID=1813 RepID=UPI001E5452D0|nr:aldolase/citrate lyase family protein [Amycolatopsis bullii]